MHEYVGYIGRCKHCGKLSFTTRKKAKAYMKRCFPGDTMTVYRCMDDDQAFHYGHTPYLVRKGYEARGVRPSTRSSQTLDLGTEVR